MPGDVEYENYPFTVTLSESGKSFDVSADESAADVLTAAGYAIETKCSDGLCGTCVAKYSTGEVEHRDYVLSKAQQEDTLTLCCSRAKDPNGELTIKL